MRSTLYWIAVLSTLYLNPDFLSYSFWRSLFHPGLMATVSPVEPMPEAEPAPDPPSIPDPPSNRPLVEEEPPPKPKARKPRRPMGSIPALGDSIDGFNGVAVYYNGSPRNVLGRHSAPDGYNLGLKYQCVEFVKRYYYYHLQHKMPNPWGHARDFFQTTLGDGQWNADRGLFQFTNPSRSKPRVHDILVFRGRPQNGFGHVAIVTQVTRERVYLIQQNAGSPRNARTAYRLVRRDGAWKIRNARIMGWLRKEANTLAP